MRCCNENIFGFHVAFLAYDRPEIRNLAARKHAHVNGKQRAFVAVIVGDNHRTSHERIVSSLGSIILSEMPHEGQARSGRTVNLRTSNFESSHKYLQIAAVLDFGTAARQTVISNMP
jgi:hypothetical protein